MPEDDSMSTEPLRLLEEEIARLCLEKERCDTTIRALRAAEDVAAGAVYAAEIFDLQQEKLRLAVEIDYRQKKMSRLRDACGAGNTPRT